MNPSLSHASTEPNRADPNPPGPAAEVRRLNDSLRRHGHGGHVMVTRGVLNLPAADRARIITAVRLFDAFGPDNNPHGEHDCATLTFGTERVIWKIDYYNREMSGHSPDPVDSAVTVRVLTIMLAEEY